MTRTVTTTTTEPLKVEVRYDTVRYSTVRSVPTLSTPSYAAIGPSLVAARRASSGVSPGILTLRRRPHTRISNLLSFSYSQLCSGFHRAADRKSARIHVSVIRLSVRAVPCRVVSCECATGCNFSLLSCPISAGGERGNSSRGVAVRQVTTSSAAERTRTCEGTARTRKRRRTSGRGGGGGGGGGGSDGCAGGKKGGGGEGTRVAARKRPAATADGGF